MTEEELEKEAEDYAFDEVNHKQEWYIKHPEHSIDCDYEDIKKHWGKGAEFGYNKAMEEWKKHFLQCSSPFCLDIFSSVKCYGELGNMTKKEGQKE